MSVTTRQTLCLTLAALFAAAGLSACEQRGDRDGGTGSTTAEATPSADPADGMVGAEASPGTVGSAVNSGQPDGAGPATPSPPAQ